MHPCLRSLCHYQLQAPGRIIAESEGSYLTNTRGFEILRRGFCGFESSKIISRLIFLSGILGFAKLARKFRLSALALERKRLGPQMLAYDGNRAWGREDILKFIYAKGSRLAQYKQTLRSPTSLLALPFYLTRTGHTALSYTTT